jgi:hypothetical protein
VISFILSLFTYQQQLEVKQLCWGSQIAAGLAWALGRMCSALSTSVWDAIRFQITYCRLKSQQQVNLSQVLADFCQQLRFCRVIATS